LGDYDGPSDPSFLFPYDPVQRVSQGSFGREEELLVTVSSVVLIVVIVKGFYQTLILGRDRHGSSQRFVLEFICYGYYK